jgi:serine/threonine-protein kinase RsbW
VSARHAVTRLGEELGFGQRRLDDLRTVVSEACMNAAVHAYDGTEGTYEVDAVASDDGVVVTVSDRGGGIRPRPAFDSPSARLGLLLIAALASRLEITQRQGGGMQIRIELASEPLI